MYPFNDRNSDWILQRLQNNIPLKMIVKQKSYVCGRIDTLPEQTIKKENIDILVIGDGEITFRKIVFAIWNKIE